MGQGGRMAHGVTPMREDMGAAWSRVVGGVGRVTDSARSRCLGRISAVAVSLCLPPPSLEPYQPYCGHVA